MLNLHLHMEVVAQHNDGVCRSNTWLPPHHLPLSRPQVLCQTVCEWSLCGHERGVHPGQGLPGGVQRHLQVGLCLGGGGSDVGWLQHGGREMLKALVGDNWSPFLGQVVQHMLVGWPVCWLVGRLAGWAVGWFVGRLAPWLLVGLLACWLVGWAVGG